MDDRERSILRLLATRGGVARTDDPELAAGKFALGKLRDAGLVELRRIREEGRTGPPEWHLTTNGRTALDMTAEAGDTDAELDPPDHDLSQVRPVKLTADEFWDFWDEWENQP